MGGCRECSGCEHEGGDAVVAGVVALTPGRAVACLRGGQVAVGAVGGDDLEDAAASEGEDAALFDELGGFGDGGGFDAGDSGGLAGALGAGAAHAGLDAFGGGEGPVAPGAGRRHATYYGQRVWHMAIGCGQQMWHDGGMATDPTKQVRDAVTAREQAEAAELEAILAALRSGVRQADVARASGYSREHLRRLAREHDIGKADG